MTSQIGKNDVDPTMYQDPTKLSFDSKSEKYCITCGKTENVNRCDRCKGAWYCDSDCQQADWPCHKILCEKYAKLNELEPIKNGYLAFLFCAEYLEPELLVLPVTSRGERDFGPITDILRREDGIVSRKIEFPGFGYNMRLKMPIYTGKIFLGMQAVHVECYGYDGFTPNKSIFATVKTVIGKEPPHPWIGNIIVRRQHDSHSGLRGGSVTMADFRHAIDWLAFYPKKPSLKSWDPDLHSKPSLQSPWSSDSFAEIQGVQIAGDQIKDEWESYKAVSVHAGHLIRGLMTQPLGSISPVSQLVGLPLRLVMQVDQTREADANYLPPTCDPAKALMRRIENDTSVDLPELASRPFPGQPSPHGRVLVVRTDDKNLAVNDLEAMAHFAKFMCHEVLQGVTLAEGEPELEAAIQRALGFITWDNYLSAFDECGLERTKRPPEEVFVDMRKPGAPNEVDDGEEVDDTWDEAEDEEDG